MKSKTCTILAILFLVLSQTAAQDLPKITLHEVLVEGNERASVSVVQSTSRLYPGREVTAIDIQRGIRRLWELGFFADIQIYLEEESELGATLKIVVAEYPSLEEVEFKGNKKIGKTKLKETIEIKSPQILSEYAISEAIRKVRHRYYEDGFLNVEVTASTEPGKRPHGERLIFDIVEHKKVRLKKIQFEGNEEISDFMLRFRMKSTKQWRWYAFWRSPFDQDKFEEDLDLIVTTYRNRGFRDARVVKDSMIVSANKRKMHMVITIAEGSQYYYRDFRWEGNTLFSDEELQRVLGLKKGDRYDKAAFDIAVGQRVHPLYMDDGYLYSRVEPAEYPVGADSVDVVFSVVENQKVSVRYIHIEGNEKTRDYVVRRELRINPGDIFSYAKLGRSQRDVWILNFFENVEPDVLPVDEDEVDLSITVSERSTDRANLSVGYTEQFGMIGGGGLEFNNFFGTGQKLNLSYNRGSQYNFTSYASANASTYQSVSLSLMNPWLLNTPNLVGISAFYTERGASQSTTLYLPFNIVQRGGSVRWGRRFRWPDNFFRGSWMFQTSEKRYRGNREDLKAYLTGVDDSQITSTGDFTGEVKTLGMSFTQSITRDSRDRPEFPTRGSEMSWLTTVSGMFLGGNEDFHKHVFNLKYFVPATEKVVFYQTMKIGIIKQVTDKGGRSILPPDEIFYLGGTGIGYGEMLRGYPDNSVGSSGSRLGGTVMLKYSAELRLLMSPNPTVYALVFADMGNSWRHFDIVDPFNLRRSAGVGVRMFMPMLGMLGLDMGYGFDSVPSDRKAGPRGWEMHFIFGQPF